VVIVEGQIAGRGRFSRSFFSPAGSGLYISFLLDPGKLGNGLGYAAAASATARAIEKVCGVAPQIKWINDIIVCGKKVGGSLAEAK
jgi:BirA family biotin operon repressor/biotin-[acetyl-CoA-carboxylase] ligase